MAYLQQYSPEQRKRIAFRCTLIFAAILIILLLIVYIKPRGSSENLTMSARIRAVYTTFLEGAQSYFTDK